MINHNKTKSSSITVKSFIVILLLVVLQALGDVCVSRGMHEVGKVTLLEPDDMLMFGLRMLFNPWLDLGMFFLLVYFLLYLASLSWLDLSYLLPMTTMGYGLNALFAWLMLKEQMTSTRWLGTLFIMGGVFIVGMGGHLRSRREVLDSSKEGRSEHPF